MQTREFFSRMHSRLFGDRSVNQKRVASFCLVSLLVIMMITIENRDTSFTKNNDRILLIPDFDEPLQIAVDEHALPIIRSNALTSRLALIKETKTRHMLRKGKHGVDMKTDNLEPTIEDGSRPVMHTFYQGVEIGEDDLLEYWKEAWNNAGWETVVLTLDDARKHPYYDEMFSVINPIWGYGYNAFCFYRWLAMAASGGGWMADYDTFPTNFPKSEGHMRNLPNGGKFTSFEAHVPSLMSGTADEWLRVTKLLIDALKEDRVENEFKTDMYTFLQLRTEGGGGERHDIIFNYPWHNVLHGFIYRKNREVDCDKMHKARAVHLSHYWTDRAFNERLFPLEVEGNDYTRKRGRAARVFLSDWEEQCGGSRYK